MQARPDFDHVLLQFIQYTLSHVLVAFFEVYGSSFLVENKVVNIADICC